MFLVLTTLVALVSANGNRSGNSDYPDVLVCVNAEDLFSRDSRTSSLLSPKQIRMMAWLLLSMLEGTHANQIRTLNVSQV